MRLNGAWRGAQVDGQFVKLCKRLVLQFVILKPILVALTIVLYARGHYTEGDWSPGSWCALACPWQHHVAHVCPPPHHVPKS